MNDRDRDQDDDSLPANSGSSSTESQAPSPSPEDIAAQRNVDMLFDRAQERSSWQPPSPPDTLGELLDSRHMLPIYLPSDPRMLGAIPAKEISTHDRRNGDSSGPLNGKRSGSHVRPAMSWRLASRKLREVEIRTLQWVDGAPSAARWYRSLDVEDEEDERPPPYSPADSDSAISELKVSTRFTPFTRSRSLARNKGRLSFAGSPHVRTPSGSHP